VGKGVGVGVGVGVGLAWEVLAVAIITNTKLAKNILIVCVIFIGDSFLEG
jgi:hypothetical protein